MNRRFNYTGRKRITRDLFTIRLHEDRASGVTIFDATLTGLKSMRLDESARVIVEPYVKQSSMRFDFGTVGDLTTPADRRLMDLDRGASIQFRIKVVDVGVRPGRLLALADHVRALTESEGDERKSILPLDYRNLGEAVWQIDVSKDQSPILVLNYRVPDLEARIGTDPVLQGAVFTAAVREVLRVVLSEDVDEEEEWVVDWRQFAEGFYGGPIPEFSDDPEDDDGRETLIEKIVERYCEHHQWATRSLPNLSDAGVDNE